MLLPDPARLRHALEKPGWQVHIHATGEFLFYGTGRRRS